jgi:hypothetical protein
MHRSGLARDTFCDRRLVLAFWCCQIDCGRSATPEVNYIVLPSITSVPHCLVAMGVEVIGLGRDKTEAMYSLRYWVVLLTLMACVAFTEAGSSRSSRDESADLSLMISAVLSSSHSSLQSATSNVQIFDGVMRVSDALVADGPTPEIADALPEQVPMQDLPAGVTQDIPAVQGHKFVKFDDRILIVNASSRVVAAMIPRYKLLP